MLVGTREGSLEEISEDPFGFRYCNAIAYVRYYRLKMDWWYGGRERFQVRDFLLTLKKKKRMGNGF